MATFPGCLLDPGGLRYQDPDYLASSDRDTWSPYATPVDSSLSQTPLEICRTISYTGIPALIPTAKVGCEIPHFARDFYDRIHVTPASVNLGQVLSDQTEQTEVWNAYRVDRTLNDILSNNVDGILFDSDQPGGIPPPPVVYPPLHSRLYNLDISVIGPPSINAVYSFVFDSETVEYRLIGQRLALFPLRADWSQPVVERFEWKTQILTSYADEQQAIALRVHPRHFLRARIGGFALNKQILEVAISQNQALPFAVPAWQDESALTQPGQVGASVIFLDTETRTFEAGGLAVLMSGPSTTEIVEIASVSPDSLSLETNLEFSWSVGAEVYPLRIMRLPQSQPTDNITGNVEFSATVWEQITPEIIAPEDAPSVTYMSYPVLEMMPNWASSRTRSFGRKMGIFDSDTGYKLWDEQGDESRITELFSWFLNGRDTIYWFKRWLYARRGRQSPIWVPSWGADMTVVDTITASSANMQILGDWGAKFFRQDPGVHHHFRLTTKAGQVFYRKVESISESATPGWNLVSFSNPDGSDGFGVDLDPKDIDLVSFLRLCTLGSDSIELQWITPGFATCDLNFYKGDQPG